MKDPFEVTVPSPERSSEIAGAGLIDRVDDRF
jgi:hypothetical protein